MEKKLLIPVLVGALLAVVFAMYLASTLTMNFTYGGI